MRIVAAAAHYNTVLITVDISPSYKGDTMRRKTIERVYINPTNILKGQEMRVAMIIE